FKTLPCFSDWASCRYNCGSNLGSCSCSSSCQYNGNCCYDYYSKNQCSAEKLLHIRIIVSAKKHLASHGNAYNRCPNLDTQTNVLLLFSNSSSLCNTSFLQIYLIAMTLVPLYPTLARPCGGSLVGSGNFASPNHPGYYYDNAYCVWYLKATTDQRISLVFTYLQLENCCSCDYISVYNGPSTSSQFLGKPEYYKLTYPYPLLSSGQLKGLKYSKIIVNMIFLSGRVNCSSDNMNITIEKTYLNSLGYDGHNLYLDDPQCRPQISRYQVVFSFPINNCGNVRKFENSRVVYTNTLRAYTSRAGEITRQSHFKINVGCRLEQDSVAQIMYLVKNRGNSSLSGTGRFNTSMAFYTSSGFYSQVCLSMPYVVTLNQNLYVQVDFGRSDSSLVLFLDTYEECALCHYSQKAMTFQFLRATDSVYIQCKVLICPQSDYNSRCRRGCTKRKARDLGSKHDSQTLVLGPIQLKGLQQRIHLSKLHFFSFSLVILSCVYHFCGVCPVNLLFSGFTVWTVKDRNGLNSIIKVCSRQRLEFLL
uniref:Uncharacterized protein n=1 Tax=Monopterus albus TaxID=43700 RepID=A0A3Q3R554_MONAL